MRGSGDDKEDPVGLHIPPQYTWVRSLDTPEPSRSIHTFSRPPVMEALSLLNVAARVGMYISAERFNQREPIFDLNGYHDSLLCSFLCTFLPSSPPIPYHTTPPPFLSCCVFTCHLIYVISHLTQALHLSLLIQVHTQEYR